MSFHVHRSNRTEALVEALARTLEERLPDPLAKECIVVQGKGMERWLSMQLATRLGVWANPSFPFPRTIIWQAIGPPPGEKDPAAELFEPETLMWAVADLLPKLLPLPEFAPLRTYLEGDERRLKRLQLAERIATTFDHYVVYRPDMILQWEQRQTDWQSILWHRLVDLHGVNHFAARAGRFIASMADGAALDRSFPRRVSLFGLSTLPPLYIDLLDAISSRIELHLFILSPSREYWADIRSRRVALRQALRRGGHLPSEEELAGIEGNPLLASLGRLGREFQEGLEAAVDYQEDDTDLYVDPGQHSMLAVLQTDILNLVNRAPSNVPSSKFQVPSSELRNSEPGTRPAPSDTSIRIHSCHGPMREIEVLHDELLALFERDPTLEPRDVIAMTPSIDAYAAYIDAVFRPSGEEKTRIPYRIADRSARVTEEVSDALFRVLDVLGGRLAASEVLDLLGVDSVRTRFGLSIEDLELVRRWVTESGIRWGADREHRRELGQPALAENTWRFGLDRLLLGYALPTDEHSLPYGVLPCDEVEGNASDVLGRLAQFCELLFSYRERLRAQRPLPAWRDELTALLGDLITTSNLNAYQHQHVRRALGALAERAERTGFIEPVHLVAVRSQLEKEVQAAASARGFLSGGVTFCELVPMRTIPFRVVCLVGMNDGDFPRLRRPLGFDKIAEQPRAGDRTVREDDRYLFLEALLSARDRLLITYVGQSISDNTEIPPSVVVSELIEAVERTFALETPRQECPAGSRAFVVRHPLQPFSPRNFGAGADAPLFSYAQVHHRGARALVHARRSADKAPRVEFVAVPLPPVEAAPRRVNLEQLVRFFEHPTRAFLQSRLGLYLGSELPPVEDREPLELNNLEEWSIGDSLLRRCSAPEHLDRELAVTRARGALPPGELGNAVFQALGSEAARILELSRGLREGTRTAVEIDVVIGDTRVTGVLPEVWPAGLVRLQYSKLGGRHELGWWIRHLLLGHATQGGPLPESETPGTQRRPLPPVRGFALETVLVGRPADEHKAGRVRFRQVADAHQHLKVMVDLYWRGLQWPLPLFGTASRRFADVLYAKPKARERAWKAAHKAFDPDKWRPGRDGEDPHVEQVYGAGATFEHVLEIQSRQSLVPSFEEIVRAVLFPLLDHREGQP